MFLPTPKTTIAVGAVLPSLAAIAVGLRFYVRFSRKIRVGLDDWLISFALVSKFYIFGLRGKALLTVCRLYASDLVLW